MYAGAYTCVCTATLARAQAEAAAAAATQRATRGVARGSLRVPRGLKSVPPQQTAGALIISISPIPTGHAPVELFVLSSSNRSVRSNR